MKNTNKEDKALKSPTPKEKTKNDINGSTSNIVISGQAPKLNPNNEGIIDFEIKCENGDLYIRMVKNNSSGLHSKEWIDVKGIFEILDVLKSKQEPFSSLALKSLFNSGSANNVSFLAAILRSKKLALIAALPTKLYSHQLSVNYEENKKKLLALAG